MHRSTHRPLLFLLALYAIASFVHFVHNAEFLSDYPGLPAAWSRAGVYFAWLAMTVIGGIGTLLLHKGRELLGLLLLAVYATLGLDSLGHYVVAPVSAHTLMMNSTILFEVGMAGLVLMVVARRTHGVFRKRAQA